MPPTLALVALGGLRCKPVRFTVEHIPLTRTAKALLTSFAVFPKAVPIHPPFFCVLFLRFSVLKGDDNVSVSSYLAATALFPTLTMDDIWSTPFGSELEGRLWLREDLLQYVPDSHGPTKLGLGWVPMGGWAIPYPRASTSLFEEDLSNDWTANLYFSARNGTYRRVTQMANQFNDGDNSSITIYYISPGPGLATAFKPVCQNISIIHSSAHTFLLSGFRMLAGDLTQRKSGDLGKKMQQCYRCYSAENWGGSPYSRCIDPKLDTDYFPTQPCVSGIRSNIIFPL